jgi:hypothetical protein
MRTLAFLDYLRVRIGAGSLLWDRLCREWDVLEWLGSGVKGPIGHGEVYRGPYGMTYCVALADGSYLLTLPGKALAACDGEPLVWDILFNADKLIRVDLAADCIGNIDDWASAAREGRVSAVSSWRVISSHTGTTVYWGGRQSQLMVRTYEHLRDPLFNLRTELEVKGELCESVRSMLRGGANLDAVFIQLMANRLAHVSGGRLRSRSSVCEWWSDVYGVMSDRLRSASRELVRSVAHTSMWLRRSCTRSLARVIGANGFDWLREWVLDALSSPEVTRGRILEDFEQKIIGKRWHQTSLSV